jgi:hypothetical protein
MDPDGLMDGLRRPQALDSRFASAHSAHRPYYGWIVWETGLKRPSTSAT